MFQLFTYIFQLGPRKNDYFHMFDRKVAVGAPGLLELTRTLTVLVDAVESCILAIVKSNTISPSVALCYY